MSRPCTLHLSSAVSAPAGDAQAAVWQKQHWSHDRPLRIHDERPWLCPGDPPSSETLINASFELHPPGQALHNLGPSPPPQEP